MKLYIGRKAKATLFLIIVALIYVVLPFDVLPFSFFDDIFVVVVMFSIWLLIAIIETKEGGENNHGK